MAEALETDQPETSIALYQDLIDALISQRGRDNYPQAAQYLTIVQRLFLGQQQEAAFRQYVQRLRDQNKTLRSLKEELARAGL